MLRRWPRSWGSWKTSPFPPSPAPAPSGPATPACPDTASRRHLPGSPSGREVRVPGTWHIGSGEARGSPIPGRRGRGFTSGSADPLKPDRHCRRNACCGIVAAGWPGQPWRRFGLPAAFRVAAAAPGKPIQFAGSGLDRSHRPHLEPYRSVKTTRGVDSHSGPPAIHTLLPSIRLADGVLRPRGPPARCRTGRIGRGGSDPPRRGLGAA